MKVSFRVTSRASAAAAAACALSAGCMLDSVLVEREETTARLRAEERMLYDHVRRLEARKADVEDILRSGGSLGSASRLIGDLRVCGFEVEGGRRVPARGVLRLRMRGGLFGADGRPEPAAVSRLARAAAMLRERLPDHELSVEATDLARAVAAVRLLHEAARVPGSRLRAATRSAPGRPGTLTLEVRPTRIEALVELNEALAAAADW